MAPKPPPKKRDGASTRDGQRRTILDVASRLLADGGAEALSMRRIAEQAGVSTMVLYTSFEGKEGLFDALVAEAFARFSLALAQVKGPNPFLHLRELAHAYRRFARENPTYYRFMWSGRAEVNVRPKSPEARLHGEQAFLALQRAVTDVLASLNRPAKDILPAALHVWSTVHGFVSLELSGAVQQWPDPDAAYEGLVDFIESGLRGASTSTAA